MVSVSIYLTTYVGMCLSMYIKKALIKKKIIYIYIICLPACEHAIEYLFGMVWLDLFECGLHSCLSNAAAQICFLQADSSTAFAVLELNPSCALSL